MALMYPCRAPVLPRRKARPLTSIANATIAAVATLALSACSFLYADTGPLRPCGSPDALCPSTDAGAGDGGRFAPDGAPLVSFARDIRPMMDRTVTDPKGPGCRTCHYQSSPVAVGIAEGKLDLTTLGSLRAGGITTKASIVIAGNPDGSGIVQKLRGTYPTGTRMPQSGPPYWTDAQIQIVVDWIAQGAVGEDSE